MSTSSTSTASAAERQEDFPVRSLQYLEGKLGNVRRVVMAAAARIAAEASPSADPFRVEPSHVDRAIKLLFDDPLQFQRELGLAD